MNTMPDGDGLGEVIGLVPAAGTASRVAPLPCSKEIFPIGFHAPGTPLGLRPKAAIHHLLENMRNAGAGRAYIILRHGKWDIPAYLGDGKGVDLPLGYLIMDLPFGVPFTLDQAYPFARKATVLFGFPDILCQPDHALRRLREHLLETRSDLVLGLFPVQRPQKMDMVALDSERRIRGITIKP
jgi:glucose-1-phosphate thymidylyltransferase